MKQPEKIRKAGDGLEDESETDLEESPEEEDPTDDEECSPSTDRNGYNHINLSCMCLPR